MEISNFPFDKRGQSDYTLVNYQGKEGVVWREK